MATFTVHRTPTTTVGDSVSQGTGTPDDGTTMPDVLDVAIPTGVARTAYFQLPASTQVGAAGTPVSASYSEFGIATSPSPVASLFQRVPQSVIPTTYSLFPYQKKKHDKKTPPGTHLNVFSDGSFDVLTVGLNPVLIHNGAQDHRWGDWYFSGGKCHLDYFVRFLAPTESLGLGAAVAAVPTATANGKPASVVQGTAEVRPAGVSGWVIVSQRWTLEWDCNGLQQGDVVVVTQPSGIVGFGSTTNTSPPFTPPKKK